MLKNHFYLKIRGYKNNFILCLNFNMFISRNQRFGLYHIYVPIILIPKI